MKTINKLIYLLFVSLFMLSCEREYEAPPLFAPEYNGKANSTIADLKQHYASITTATLIESQIVISGYITANDESGNVYKQLYLQDETGAINIGIDQSSMFSTYRVGQQVFIELEGLYMVSYGGELQVGYGNTNANRIPWLDFTKHAHLNGWPNPAKVEPQTVTINGLTASMVNKLIKLENIHFVNGGKNSFSKPDATTNEQIKDANGNVLDVRTSSYSNFAADILPKGTGSLVGVLGRFNGSWQLLLRDRNDIGEFDGKDPITPVDPVDPTENVVFYETFGKGTYPSGSRPKIADFTDFDMKAPVVYADASASVDIRSISGDNGAHAWLPAAKDSYLTITGINTANKNNLVLTFQLAANLYNPTDEANFNAIAVSCNNTPLAMPSINVSNANGDKDKFYTFTFENIPASENLKIEFFGSATANKLGFRLDNIKIATKGSSNSGGNNNGGIVIEPSR